MAAAAFSGRAVRAVEVGSTVAAARKKVPRPKLRDDYKAAQRPVITCMTVVVGAGFLNAWLVDKKALPERRFIVRLAILGFSLSLLSEISPTMGKGMSYLVMTGVIFDRSQNILRELQKKPGVTGGTGGTGLPPEPLTPPFENDTTPVTLYTRQGPMTTTPLLPQRSRIKRPQAGAWAQA